MSCRLAEWAYFVASPVFEAIGDCLREYDSESKVLGVWLE